MKNLLLGTLLLLMAGCAAPSGKKMSYIGTWSTTGSDNDIYNIEVSKNSTALTNYYRGPSGAKGERGTWKRYSNGIMIQYDSGWKDWIEPKRQQISFEKRGFKPGTTEKDLPDNIVSIYPMSGPGLEYIGVWKLADQGYLALLSDGTAARNFTNGTTVTGKWKFSKTGAQTSWPDEAAISIVPKGRNKYNAVLDIEANKKTVIATREKGTDK